MNAPSVQGSPYTRTDTTTNFSEPSTLPGIPRTPTAVRYQEQRASQDMPQDLRGTGRGPAAVPSGSSRGPAASGNGRAPAGRYLCDICSKSYSQPQGLKRHQREKHDASLCKHCGAFAWGRLYRLKEHLEEQHPGIDIAAALEEATRTRRRATGQASSRGDQITFT
jgi:hypothetical protein